MGGAWPLERYLVRIARMITDKRIDHFHKEVLETNDMGCRQRRTIERVPEEFVTIAAVGRLVSCEKVGVICQARFRKHGLERGSRG
jgi:hypothetical protein